MLFLLATLVVTLSQIDNVNKKQAASQTKLDKVEQQTMPIVSNTAIPVNPQLSKPTVIEKPAVSSAVKIADASVLPVNITVDTVISLLGYHPPYTSEQILGNFY